MKHINSKKIIRAILIIVALIIALLFILFISLNFIVNPIIYWLASTEGIRIFIACILSWLILSIFFDIFYIYYKRRREKSKFNALSVPYPRKFKGRKKKIK